MAISEEMNAQIEQAIGAIERGNYLRPGMSYNDFVREFSQLLAQAQEDEDLLTGAGFDATLIPLYYGYLEKLTVEHGDRINAELEKSEAEVAFSSAMPQADSDKSLLMAMGRYVVARADKPEVKKVYDMVRKGSGDVDTLNDIIAMVNFARRHRDLASEVRPGGQRIDERFLTRVENDALKLMKLRGVAVTSADDTSEQIDRQNRLITLCVQAQREIKLFAEMAFYNDVERYNRFYASATQRAQRRQAQLPIDAPPSDSIPENVQT